MNSAAVTTASCLDDFCFARVSVGDHIFAMSDLTR
jgi:hypothetical protein